MPGFSLIFNGTIMKNPIVVSVDVFGKETHKLDGQLHNANGPAVLHQSGAEEWYIDGKRSRVGGPAITNSDNSMCWCFDDVLHREDGPAVKNADGSCEWWVSGKQLSEEEFNSEYGQLFDVGC